MPAGLVPQGLAEALRCSRHTVVLTGAGVSAESGIPTFRDAQTGIWARYDPLELATPEGFARNPQLVWDWYRWRRELVAAAEPNPGHVALAALQDHCKILTLVTQNVDGLHARAGSRDVIELHGNLFVDRCSAGCAAPQANADEDGLPRCHCGALLRPGVVWFGEALPDGAIDTAMAACRNCDLLLSVGTSSQVWPAAGLGEIAAQSGALLAEINPEATELAGRCDFVIAAASGRVLPELLDCVAGPKRPEITE